MSNYVYVFLHGLFVVNENPQLPQKNPLAAGADYLQVVLPEVSGHVYRAGGWLAESEIASGKEIYLLGVTPAHATFKSTIDLSQASQSPTSLNSNSTNKPATLWLYKPDQILDLLHASVDITVNPADYVVQTNDQKQRFPDIATVQVLIYQYDNENDVRLDGHTWEPCSTEGAISLHIISTSPEPEGEAHERETDKALKDLLTPYHGLTFKKDPRPLVASWIDPPDNPKHMNDPRHNFGDYSPLTVQEDYFVDSNFNYAFLHAELEHLTLRNARLGRLGRLKQQRKNIESVWSDPDPLADRASNCATIKTS
ncbi:MAG TPA: hypothetical protein VG759_26830 [Candidatus Angelobacter sp.]|nr:hypothetical protein [Candidatus Angelobacter sp.]